MKGAPYLVVFESGQEFKGNLDDKGFAKFQMYQQMNLIQSGMVKIKEKLKLKF